MCVCVYVCVCVRVCVWVIDLFFSLLSSMWLNDDQVFFPFIILFEFFKFIFCNCISVCSVLFGYEVFLFSKVGGSFRIDCSCCVSTIFVWYCITVLFIICFLAYF